MVPARTCYPTCTALSSSLLLSGVHVACTSTSLGAISLPCLLPCSGLLSRQRFIHSTWRYFGGAVLIWYTVSRLVQHVTANLATQAASILRLSLRLPFLFCSLEGFHLECTSNSLGATSLWPAGLPKAIKYHMVLMTFQDMSDQLPSKHMLVGTHWKELLHQERRHKLIAPLQNINLNKSD